MRPLDPRLLRWARSIRPLLVILVAFGVVTAILIVLQAKLLAIGITDIFQKEQAPSFNLIAFLMGIFATRAIIVWLAESVASRAAIRAKSDLRIHLARRLLSADQTIRHTPAELTHLSTRGIDALDAYFSRYLPQLVLAMIVPISLSLVVLSQDWLSAVLLFITLPLIPVFAILIGLYTKENTDRQLNSLNEISNYFTDVISGLSTLRIFGRTKSQSKNLEQIDNRYRKSTMGVLRISFLSSLALELLASISVAMIAVGIGLRLIDGKFDLATGLFILILTPEIYLPLRAVGAQFHAAAEGLTAAEQILDYLEDPPAELSSVDEITTFELINLRPVRGDLVLPAIDLIAKRGSLTVVVGESGSGKTSLFRALMGTTGLNSGSILVNGDELVNPISLRNKISWLPQYATNLAGTVFDTLRMADTELSEKRAVSVLQSVGLELTELSSGLNTEIDELGSGVSVGQRRKIALARAILRDSDLLFLDEPTASLDIESEKKVIDAILGQRDLGRIIIATAHRSDLVRHADQVVSIDGQMVKR